MRPGRPALQLLQLLMEHRADPRRPIGLGRDQPLHLAAWRGSADACGLLVEAQAAVDAVNAGGHTPLSLAAAQNRTAAARLLLELRANARHEVREHSQEHGARVVTTPTDAALAAGHWAMFQMLLQAAPPAAVALEDRLPGDWARSGTPANPTKMHLRTAEVRPLEDLPPREAAAADWKLKADDTDPADRSDPVRTLEQNHQIALGVLLVLGATHTRSAPRP